MSPSKPVSPGQRPRLRWAAIVPLALALPPALLGCDQSKAMLPLMAACNGQAVPDAVAYDASASEKPTVAGFVFNQEVQQFDQRFVSGRFPEASAVQDTQLVLCVNFQPRKSLEDCSYTGSLSGTVPRTERSAEVKLVAAKTGQIVKQETLTATIETCPDSISEIPPDSSWNIHQDTVLYNPFNADFPLRDQVSEWSFQAIAPPSAPKP